MNDSMHFISDSAALAKVKQQRKENNLCGAAVTARNGNNNNDKPNAHFWFVQVKFIFWPGNVSFAELKKHLCVPSTFDVYVSAIRLCTFAMPTNPTQFSFKHFATLSSRDYQ